MHKKLYESGKYKINLLYNKFKEFGQDSFYIILIENFECNNKEELLEREEQYIKKMGTLNIKSGNITDYHFIKHITNNKKLRETKHSNEETEKAFFNTLFKNKDDPRINHIYVELWTKKGDKKNYLNNIILEHEYINYKIKFNRDYGKYNNSCKKDQKLTGLKYSKFEIIKKLNKALNIECSFLNPKIKCCELNERFKEFITQDKIIDEIKLTFKSDVKAYKFKYINDLKYNRNFITSIYKAFNGSKLINDASTMKRTKQTNIINYFVLINVIDGDRVKTKIYNLNSENKFSFENLFKTDLEHKNENAHFIDYL